MADTIIFQGSGGTIGDIFFSSLPMFHQHVSNKKKIFVALPKDLKQEIKDLYKHHTFLEGVVELDSIQPETLIPFAESKGYETHLFLKNLNHLRGHRFYYLDQWFKNPEGPTLDSKGCILVQIMSTSHWDRPPIPHWKKYLQLIIQSGLKPLFVGTKKDEQRCADIYPGLSSFCKGEEYWRFGRDSILQTLANARNCEGALVFSSWTTYGSLLQGVPALELWGRDQWNFYSPVVRAMLGQPPHYLQDAYDSPPPPPLFVNIFPRLRTLLRLVHGG